ncbi:MAG: hypothetical protein ACE5IM_14240, partial [Nitrospinota bacterium]
LERPVEIELLFRLAYQRHFPAINWLNSYSLYLDQLEGYFAERVGAGFQADRRRAMEILQKESELEEVVRLIGMDALSVEERLILETARSIREDFLHQNAFHEEDTYSSLMKQACVLRLTLQFHEAALRRLEAGEEIGAILADPLRGRIARAKYVAEEECEAVCERLGAEVSGSADAGRGVADGGAPVAARGS